MATLNTKQCNFCHSVLLILPYHNTNPKVDTILWGGTKALLRGSRRVGAVPMTNKLTTAAETEDQDKEVEHTPAQKYKYKYECKYKFK